MLLPFAKGLDRKDSIHYQNAMQAASAPADGGPKRKRRSAEELTDRILRAAREEFNRSGLSGATTAAIARRAEVTEAQLFRYFASKSELFREAVFNPLKQQLRELQAQQAAPVDDEEDFREGSRRYITQLHRFLSENGKLLLALMVARTYASASSDGLGEMDSLAAYFDTGAAMMARRAGGQPKVDPKLMVRVSFAAVLGATLFGDWLFPEGLASDEAIETAIIDFVLEGIRGNPEPPAQSQGSAS
jgi:AcrR family transcriptional regulator